MEVDGVERDPGDRPDAEHQAQHRAGGQQVDRHAVGGEGDDDRGAQAQGGREVGRAAEGAEGEQQDDDGECGDDRGEPQGPDRVVVLDPTHSGTSKGSRCAAGRFRG
ncbi:hypothetical protein HNR12_005357 [Streptomonospora nanhaiensis]|uniref:Uncharacterized protein n=1 Tax=Streptomonospora nanhaiensis TaxID=1323731 RepID=A0A853BVS5_9ACTN|nr:hypothetical protein [Streptomonospora nanhaiensis]